MDIITWTGTIKDEGSDPRTVFPDSIPLILLGIDTHPRKLASVMGEGDWQIPLTEGWLVGAEALWASWFSPAGTLGTTLRLNPDAGISASLLWVSKEVLTKLQLGLPEYQLVELDSCRFSSIDGDLAVTSPKALIYLGGALLIDGEPRAVAAVKSSGSHLHTAMLAEALIWIANHASQNGLPYDSPRLLVDKASQKA